MKLFVWMHPNLDFLCQQQMEGLDKHTRPWARRGEL